jgi:hypothetical protein
MPPALAPTIQPFIGNMVTGIHDAFSLAVSSTFWIGAGAAIVAALAAAGMEELALRRTAAPATRATASSRPAVGLD